MTTTATDNSPYFKGLPPSPGDLYRLFCPTYSTGMFDAATLQNGIWIVDNKRQSSVPVVNRDIVMFLGISPEDALTGPGPVFLTGAGQVATSNWEWWHSHVIRVPNQTSFRRSM